MARYRQPHRKLSSGQRPRMTSNIKEILAMIATQINKEHKNTHNRQRAKLLRGKQ